MTSRSPDPCRAEMTRPPLVMALRGRLIALLSLATWLLDSILLRFITRLHRVPSASPVLLVVRPDRLGDMVLWLPAALRILESWRSRGFRVVAIVNSDYAEWARQFDGFDEVWPLRRRSFVFNPLYRGRFLAKIWRCAADEALHPVWSRELFTGDAIIRFSAAGRRIGWQGDLMNATRLEKWLGNHFYTDVFDAPAAAMTELQRNENLLEQLGIPLLPADRLALPGAKLPGVSLPNNYYVIAPGARRRERQWPSAKFAAIAARIHEATGLVGVICGAPNEIGLGALVVSQAGGVPLIDLSGQTGLEHLTDIIAQADFAVCNESSVVHLAAALGVACVCIAGGGHYGRFVPYAESRLTPLPPSITVTKMMPCYGCNWTCRYPISASGGVPCIRDVGVDQVWREIEGLIAKDSG